MVEGSEGNVTLRVDDKDGSRIFRRHAMRVNSGQTHTRMIGELDGVRVYVEQVQGSMLINVIMTTEDLYA